MIAYKGFEKNLSCRGYQFNAFVTRGSVYGNTSGPLMV